MNTSDISQTAPNVSPVIPLIFLIIYFVKIKEKNEMNKNITIPFNLKTKNTNKKVIITDIIKSFFVVFFRKKLPSPSSFAGCEIPMDTTIDHLPRTGNKTKDALTILLSKLLNNINFASITTTMPITPIAPIWLSSIIFIISSLLSPA
ncbi:MAG: hypothetical protein A2551_02550 [Elusimicrobia bacterium RIFOXYD2_FULL_34_30]|nr:MAG: hypothetical protein A2551_02550 [Elusimicrobia bacterium RIFOXYD2_FULL_34_30]